MKMYILFKGKILIEKLIFNKVINSVLLILIGTCMFGQNKQVCFTIDDLPVASDSFTSIDFQTTVSEKILAALKRHRIPAIGFVNGSKLYTGNRFDSQKMNLLKMWLSDGMKLGNHTFAHKDYNITSYDEFINDIKKCEQEILKVNANFNKAEKYFRHPYLHVGNTKEKADSLYQFLKVNGYVEAPVTIDHSDWIFTLAYDSAMVKGDSSMMKKIGKAYLDFAEQKLKYIEGQAEKLFKRKMKHILLLHANSINADYLEDIVAIYKKNGYRFISLRQALKDKVYEIKIRIFVEWGIPWLDRWALSAGKKDDFFKEEPITPDYIMKLAKVDHY
jgi:peptidoglycan/xylan/chitin deacetylase (PgdA/CDA1 family)